jgi:hypothetical protein
MPQIKEVMMVTKHMKVKTKVDSGNGGGKVNGESVKGLDLFAKTVIVS